jgi:RNA polymerase sigma factor (sigma-70 family)
VARLDLRHASSDAQLLEQYCAAERDEAFAILFGRHGPLVYEMCLRTLRHEQDAEDAVQATFLVLARRADQLADCRSLPGWLCGVARRVALKFRTRAIRCKKHERLVEPKRSCDFRESMALAEWVGILREEVERLPDLYRTPIVLCCLEGRSREDAAAELGWSIGSIKGRLERARALLQLRLRRRGVGPSDSA